MKNASVQDKNRVTQVLRCAKPGLHGFCPVPKKNAIRLFQIDS